MIRVRYDCTSYMEKKGILKAPTFKKRQISQSNIFQPKHLYNIYEAYVDAFVNRS